ncbi:hypothetical protein MICRO8M_130140 [Microbacterium sp. 8M]|nr:hypothetical protein MICRO8M_130140 [Microbacterium sp. 8M]
MGRMALLRIGGDHRRDHRGGGVPRGRSRRAAALGADHLSPARGARTDRLDRPRPADRHLPASRGRRPALTTRCSADGLRAALTGSAPTNVLG